MDTDRIQEMMQKFWGDFKGFFMLIVSVFLMASLVICVLVNSGVAEVMADHSVIIYIVNSMWFSTIAFCSCKYLRGYIKPTATKKKTSSNGKYSAPKSIVKR